MNVHTVREIWLLEFAKRARKHVHEKAGLIVPDRLRIGVGLLGTPGRPISGTTYAKGLASDGAVEITIAPRTCDTRDVAGTLVHELIHACGVHGHQKDFAKAGRALGLEGKPKEMGYVTATPAWVDAILKRMGNYPQGTLTDPPKRKVQGTRMLKAECPECGMIVRASRQALAGKDLTCMDSDCHADIQVDLD